MTDNEIIRILTDYGNQCRPEIISEAINLINRQKAEIERLKVLVDEMGSYFPSCINCEGKTPLGERTDKCVYVLDDYDFDYCTRRGIDNIHAIEAENHSLKEQIKVAKAEVIKEFVERFKTIATVVHKTHSGNRWYEIDDNDIDNLVKEKTEVEE